MKRLILSRFAILALSVIGLYSAVSADPVDRSEPVLAMMGVGGSMMGGQVYGGMGDNMGEGGFGQGYASDLSDYPQRYQDTRHCNRDDSHKRQKLRDELHRQRQELSKMIHSGNADPDAVDRKMDRIERLESRLDSNRW